MHHNERDRSSRWQAHKVTGRKKKSLQANKYRHGFKYSTIPSSSHSASEGASLPGEINLQATTRQQFHTSSRVKKNAFQQSFCSSSAFQTTPTYDVLCEELEGTSFYASWSLYASFKRQTLVSYFSAHLFREKNKGIHCHKDCRKEGVLRRALVGGVVLWNGKRQKNRLSSASAVVQAQASSVYRMVLSRGEGVSMGSCGRLPATTVVRKMLEGSCRVAVDGPRGCQTAVKCPSRPDMPQSLR